MQKSKRYLKQRGHIIMYTVLLTAAVFYVTSGWLFAEETSASNAQETEETLASVL